MVEEAYVSFETAKLLKEKGFNEPCICYSYGEGMNNYFSKSRIIDNLNKDASYILLPTQQMAMRWLRDVHNIYINIAPTHNVVDGSINFIWLTYSSSYSVTGECDIFYKTYEQACEAVIKYGLENLI